MLRVQIAVYMSSETKFSISINTDYTIEFSIFKGFMCNNYE